MKKTKRKNKIHSSKTKLLYSHYVDPGDGWIFLGSSDPSIDSLDAPLLSPSCVAFNQLHVPPSFDVMGTQDPFDFINPNVTITSDEYSFSSDSTVEYMNIQTQKQVG